MHTHKIDFYQSNHEELIKINMQSNFDWIILLADGIVCTIYWLIGNDMKLSNLYSKQILGNLYNDIIDSNVFSKDDVYDMMLYIATSAYITFITVSGITLITLCSFNGLTLGYIMFCRGWGIIGDIIILYFLSAIVSPYELFGKEPNTIITRKILIKGKIPCALCNKEFNEASMIKIENGNAQHIWCR